MNNHYTHDFTPSYICPTCRERVFRKPVQVYALKNIVRHAAAALGQSVPEVEEESVDWDFIF